MTTARDSRLHDGAAPAARGLSRRSMLTRSAAGAGIALSGSVAGLFGSGIAPAGAHDRAGRAPRGRAGCGPLIDDPAGLLSVPGGFTYVSLAGTHDNCAGGKRNEDPEDSEFAGPTFSHDKKLLFANVQSPGYVFAIRGPFRKQC